MSRDLKPWEQYAFDLELKNALRNSPIHYILKGENKEIRVDNHLAKDRYPELSFLFERFDELYQKYEDSETALEFLDKVEQTVKDHEDSMFYDSLPFVGNEIDKIVGEWFDGELDPNFHYSEHNNRLFEEWLTESIEKEIENERMFTYD